jgi:hypothetical protein
MSWKRCPFHVFPVVRTQLSSVTVSHPSSFTSLTLFVTSLLSNPFTPLRRLPVYHRVFVSLHTYTTRDFFDIHLLIIFVLFLGRTGTRPIPW